MIAKKCCCYLSLHTGTVIIGYLCCIWALAECEGIQVFVQHLEEDMLLTTLGRRLSWAVPTALNLGHFMLSLMLVVASYKKRPWIVLSWTIATIVYVIIIAVMSLIFFVGVGLLLEGDFSPIPKYATGFFAVFLIKACLGAYCIMTVQSRFKEMMNEMQEESTVRYRVLHNRDALV